MDLTDSKAAYGRKDDELLRLAPEGEGMSEGAQDASRKGDGSS